MFRRGTRGKPKIDHTALLTQIQEMYKAYVRDSNEYKVLKSIFVTVLYSDQPDIKNKGRDKEIVEPEIIVNDALKLTAKKIKVNTLDNILQLLLDNIESKLSTDTVNSIPNDLKIDINAIKLDIYIWKIGAAFAMNDEKRLKTAIESVNIFLNQNTKLSDPDLFFYLFNAMLEKNPQCFNSALLEKVTADDENKKNIFSQILKQDTTAKLQEEAGVESVSPSTVSSRTASPKSKRLG